MSEFEKVIKIDPSFDHGNGYEQPVNIEKSDFDYFKKSARKAVEEMKQQLRVKNEESKSKKTKGRVKKDNPKLHKTAMENI